MDVRGTRGGDVTPGKKLDSVQSNTLEALRRLSKQSETQRVQGGLTLIRRLVGKPYESKSGSGREKNEIDYVLERLIRGVGASRNDARTGYFATLVSFLTCFPSIPLKDVLEVVKKELAAGKNVSKSEAADVYMGQVLVYGAFIRSGRFLNASGEEQTEILTSLITAGRKRTYLTLVAHTFLIQLIRVADKKLFKKIIWPAIQDSAGLSKDIKDLSLDELHLLLAVKSSFPKMCEEDSVFTPGNIPNCANTLLNIPNISYIKHPVYEEYCKHIASTDHLLLFWSEIERHLSKPNRNRQLLTLELLKHIFTHLQDKNQITAFMTAPFINVIIKSKINSKHSQGNNSHDIFNKIKELFPILMNNLQNESVADMSKVEVLQKLLFHPGNFMIEKDTGLKIVQPITTSLTLKGVQILAKVYQDVVSGNLSVRKGDGSSEERPDFKTLPWKNKERIYAAQLLARLVGVPVMATDHDWKFEQAKFLLHWGVFSKQLNHSDSDEMGVVGLELSHALRESFFRCLDHKAGGLNSSIYVLLKLVHHVDELLKDDSVEEKALKGKVLEDWDKAMVVIRKLENQTKKADDKNADDCKPKGEVGEGKVFLLLFLHLALQLFDWDAKLAAESLEELNTCYAKLERERKQKGVGGELMPLKKTRKQKKIALSEEEVESKENEIEDPAWVEVVVDLFLHLLSQNRHLLRSIVGSVFSHLCPRVTPTALHSIVQVLDSRSGKNPLHDSDDEGSGEEGSDEDVSKDSDNGSNEEEEDDQEASEGDSDEEEEPTVNEALKMAVQKALGTAAPASDTESMDVDEIEEKEGQQLDAALSDAFRLLKVTKVGGKAKKQQTKDERLLTHFRVRVVDLLEIYIDSYPSMALCCDLIIPLLETLEFCIRDVHQKPLENRLRACFKKLSHIKSFSTTEGMEDTILCDLLSALLDKGSKTAPIYLEMGNEIMYCCTFVVKSSEYLRKQSEKSPVKKSKNRKSEGHNTAISDIYKKSLETFFTKRDCLLPVGMFRQVIQLSWPGRWRMLPVLVQYGFDQDVRPFRRNQAIQLLTSFFQSYNSVSSPDEAHQEELISLKKEIYLQSIKFLESVAEMKDSSKMGKKCLVCLLSLLQAIWSSEGHNKIFKCEPEENIAESDTVYEGMDWASLGSLLSSVYCRQMKYVSPDGKKAVGKLLKSLGLGDVITKHRAEKSQKAQEVKENSDLGIKDEVAKVDSESGESSEEDGDEMKMSEEEKKREKRKKKKKRKKASKIESRKLKKQAKEFRMQEFSKGLESSSFVDIGTVPEDNEEGEGAIDKSLNKGKSDKSKKRKSDSHLKKVKKIKTEENE